MIDTAEIRHNLRGAIRLAAQDTGGMAAFDTTLTGFWRSFRAALVVAPLFLMLVLVQHEQAEQAAGLLHFLVMEGLAYTIAWFLFPVVMLSVTRWMDREENYIPLIVALNWSNVLRLGAICIAALLAVGGVLPAGLAAIVQLVVFMWALFYEWFVIRTALDVTGGQAAALVALDLVLGALVTIMAGVY